MKVAILSVDYLPLMYCDVKRALCLLYLGKAEMVKATEDFIHTISDKFQIPKVIRLLSRTRKKFKPKIVFTRRNVFIRDNWTCQYCGTQSKRLTLDHVHPRSRGGTHTWDNVVASCGDCNSAKGDKTPTEWGMPLKRKPKKPTMLMQIDWDEIFG